MNNPKFEYHRKKRKTWLFPLIIIVLLYITIPLLLIFRGDKAISESLNNIQNSKILIPSKAYYTGAAFLETARLFPGFSTWSDNLLQKANQKMYNIYPEKYKLKSADLLKNFKLENTDYDSVFVNISSNNEKLLMKAEVFSKQGLKHFNIEINEELKQKIESDFCEPWTKFFHEFKLKLPQEYILCRN